MGYRQAIAASCERTVAALTHLLIAQGYQLERSFDLRSALRDQSDCLCPAHGATTCHCQYLVLLAYKHAAPTPPAVITAHECDGITRLQIEGLSLPVAFTVALEEVTSHLPDTI